MSEIIGQADKTTAILVTSTFDFWTIAIIALDVLMLGCVLFLLRRRNKKK